jgi:hypothetical protein
LITPFLAKSLFYAKQWLTALENHLPQGYEPVRPLLDSMASSLHFPLVIRLLAYSALLASVGKVIYLLRCPAYFRVGDSFAEFKRQHPFALRILQDEFIDFWNGLPKGARHGITDDFQVTHGFTLQFFLGANWQNDLHPLHHDTIMRLGFRSDFVGPRIPDGNINRLLKVPAFGEAIVETLLVHRDYFRRWSRLSCAWSYYFALLLFSVAVILQAWWVLFELF